MGRDPVASKPKVTKDRLESDNKSPEKKKCKVISKETIECKDVSEDGEAEGRLQSELMWVLWVILTELCLLCKSQEASFKALTKIAEDVLYVAYNMDQLMNG